MAAGGRLSQHRGAAKNPWSLRKKIGIAVIVLFCVPPFIAGMISGVRQGLGGKPSSSGTDAPSIANKVPPALETTAQSKTHQVHARTPEKSPPILATTAQPKNDRVRARKASVITGPSFSYPGDPECVITYGEGGSSATSWNAQVTVAGELITHASDSRGNIYRHDVQVTPGSDNFTAQVPLSQVTDIGGVLYTPNDSSPADTSYGCSVAPQRVQ